MPIKNSGNQWENVRNLKEKAKTLLFLQDNGIETAEQLNEKIDNLRNEYFSVRRKIKSVEHTLNDLSEKLKQAEIYEKYKPIRKEYLSLPQKQKTEYYNNHTGELILCNAAVDFLKKVIVHGKLPIEKWRAEFNKLTMKKKNLYDDMCKLHNEVKEIENVKKYVDAITQKPIYNKNRRIDKER